MQYPSRMHAITILDGGTGGELARRGAGGRTELWSAQALLDAPDVVAEVHRDYVDAGARIIITNSYSTIPSYLGKLDMAARYEELTRLAGQIAREVADSVEPSVRVAGSMPPLDESYRADLVPDAVAALAIYRRLAAALNPYVDLFMCETMSTAQEAHNAAVAALEASAGRKPVYVSWTLAEQPGQGLRSGESIADAFGALADLDIAAFLFNCTTPEAIREALCQLNPLTDKPIGAYPNRLHIPAGWTLDNEIASERLELGIDQYVTEALRWTELGATIIGGCCGIGPEYISALDATLRASRPAPG